MPAVAGAAAGAATSVAAVALGVVAPASAVVAGTTAGTAIGAGALVVEAVTGVAAVEATAAAVAGEFVSWRPPVLRVAEPVVGWRLGEAAASSFCALSSFAARSAAFWVAVSRSRERPWLSLSSLAKACAFWTGGIGERRREVDLRAVEPGLGLRGDVGAGAQLQVLLEMVHRADRIVEMVAVEEAEFVMGLGDVGIVAEGVLVFLRRVGEIPLLDVGRGGVEMGIRIVLGAERLVVLLATEEEGTGEGEESPEEGLGTLHSARKGTSRGGLCKRRYGTQGGSAPPLDSPLSMLLVYNKAKSCPRHFH